MARLAAVLGHGATLAIAALLLAAAAQPLFTDDAWWHLALGRAFAAGGPWLTEDPLLYAAASPPSPAAWLFDLGLHGVHQWLGFPGLRALHAALVAASLGLAWGLLRRASGSALAASAGTVIFVALSAYRFAQLRPHLVTIAFALLLWRLLIEGGRAPSGRRIAAGAALFALWANLHAAFPVGLLLLGAAAAAVALDAWLGGSAAARVRAMRLAWAWLAGLAATLCNPLGFRSHAAWLAAGSSTPSLGRVIDEWAPVNPFAWPQPTLPPTPLAWAMSWGLLLGALWLAAHAIAARRSAGNGTRTDPAALGAAAIALALLFGAVRFLYLGIFPLLVLARAAAPALARPHAPAALAVATACLAAAFLRWGDWPLITRALPTTATRYAEPYAAHKYYAEPIWLARDAELEGHLFTDYFQAGFANFWLAPRVRTLTNGTLNVAPETLQAASALMARRGLAEGETFPALLERLDLDLYLGIRVPETGNPHRPWASTTAHLEDTPGWIPIFRNLSSALYLRDHPRNRENLARVARHYAAEAVPFDPERGFDPLRAARAAPDWAHAHGLVPRAFGVLEHTARTAQGARGERARDLLAGLYTALGAHGEAVELDRARLATKPELVRARRRLVWNLLHLARYDEAARAAAPFAQRPEADALSHLLARAAGELAALPASEARARLAGLPVFQRSEVPWLLGNTTTPEPRRE